jgi:hypothetical protein
MHSDYYGQSDLHEFIKALFTRSNIMNKIDIFHRDNTLCHVHYFDSWAAFRRFQ